MCSCRPGVVNTCDECTKKPTCIWIKDGKLDTTWALGSFQFHSNANISETCWPGLPNGPVGLVQQAAVPSIGASVTNVRTISNWCWGQCKLDKEGPFLIMAVVALLFLCCGLMCICRIFTCFVSWICCCAKRSVPASRYEMM